MSTLRHSLALTVVLCALAWSRPAHAQVTITGTVGEIGVFNVNLNGSIVWVQFKLTDATQTATCAQQNIGAVVAAKYAYFFPLSGNNGGTAVFKEWYAQLLVSKKGAPINCILQNNTNCVVTSCTLP